MSIRIITDSASDILQSDAEKMGITVLPLKTIFSTGEYIDGVTLSHKEFFEKLIELGEISKTSQITPFEYEEEYKKYSNDEIIVITLSSKLSGCNQSANIAASEYKNVYVVDSLNATVGERLLVEYALRLIKEGKSAKEIVDILNNEKDNICLIALLDTLEYLKKGGRISSTTAFIGTLLHIKPVITIKDGKVESLGKARGSKNGNNMLRKLVNEYGMDLSLPYEVAYSGLTDVLLKKYLEDNKDLYEGDIEKLSLRTIGSTIGTHVGPGAIALAFFKKNK